MPLFIDRPSGKDVTDERVILKLLDENRLEGAQVIVRPGNDDTIVIDVYVAGQDNRPHVFVVPA